MRSTKANSALFLLISLVIFVACLDSVTAKSHISSIDALIPSTLVVPKGNEVQQILIGVGAQIYTYNGTAWALTNVSADLYNFKGLKVGHHFFLGEKDKKGGQASWETFHPFSRVTGKGLASVAIPLSDSIDWVLLEATSHIGKKKFLGSSTFVQRLYTEAGNPPSADVPAEKGDIYNSSYSALYKFSTKCA